MTRWWPLAVLLAVVAMLVSTTTASASSALQPETRVGGFDLVALPVVGLLAAPSAEEHRGNSVAYGETARGYSLAAEGVEAAGSTIVRAGEDIPATFIGQESGPSIVVPQGATGPTPTWNGAGAQWTGGAGGPGLSDKVSGLRIMDPTLPRGPSPGYPGGYASYFNATGQTVNPYTGQTIGPSNPWWHIILPW